jgi:hypothetical protein
LINVGGSTTKSRRTSALAFAAAVRSAAVTAATATMIAVHQAWTGVLRRPPLTTQSHLDTFGEESLVIASALLY